MVASTSAAINAVAMYPRFSTLLFTSSSARQRIAPSLQFIDDAASKDQESTPNPPVLNVVIQVVGSRGDVQPLIALGKVLEEKYGHGVRLATHPCSRTFVVNNGMEFFSIGGDPTRFMAENPRRVPNFGSIMNEDITKNVSEYIQRWPTLNVFESRGGKCRRTTGSCPPRKKTNKSQNTQLEMEDPTVSSRTDVIIAKPSSFAHIHRVDQTRHFPSPHGVHGAGWRDGMG